MVGKACLVCGRFATRGAYCDRCAQRPVATAPIERAKRKREYNPDKDRPRRLVRDKKWAKLSKAFLAKNPICIACEWEGKTVAAKVSDHIRPFWWDAAGRYDENNLQSLCVRHHAQKSGKERVGILYDWRNRRRILLTPEQLRVVREREREELAYWRRP